MKNLKLAFAFALTLFAVHINFAQSRISGKVVEIIDGRTVAIETPSRTRIIAELQYIEVPAVGQPFHQTAVGHLRTLVLDRIIEFRAHSLKGSVTVGQLSLKGVDISQQMIRDGAAWYAILERKSQNASDSEIYRSNEAQAKTEKRGIWSVENLKPSWEIRAEAEESRRQQEVLARAKFQQQPARTTTRRAAPRQLTNSDFGAWADVNNYIAEQSVGNGGLEIRYDSAARFGQVATTRALQNLTAKNSQQAVDFRMGYFYRDSARGRDSIYLVGILSEAENWKFLKSNSLTIFADGQKIVLGKAFRLSRRAPHAVQELLLYKISRSAMTKIAKAKNLEANVGVYSGKLSDKFQMMLKNLLEAAA